MKKYITNACMLLIGVVAGVLGIVNFAENEIKKEKRSVNEIDQVASKYLELFLLMNQWVKVKQRKRSIADFLERKGYKRIAIYGMSYVGSTLVEELKDSKVHVLYGIDKKMDSIQSNLNIVTIEDELKEVDAIIVTAITFYDEIKNELRNKVTFPVISLKDVLYEI